jgi:hypothetical protein
MPHVMVEIPIDDVEAGRSNEEHEQWKDVLLDLYRLMWMSLLLMIISTPTLYMYRRALREAERREVLQALIRAWSDVKRAHPLFESADVTYVELRPVPPESVFEPVVSDDENMPGLRYKKRCEAAEQAFRDDQDRWYGTSGEFNPAIARPLLEACFQKFREQPSGPHGEPRSLEIPKESISAWIDVLLKPDAHLSFQGDVVDEVVLRRFYDHHFKRDILATRTTYVDFQSNLQDRITTTSNLKFPSGAAWRRDRYLMKTLKLIPE